MALAVGLTLVIGLVAGRGGGRPEGRILSIVLKQGACTAEGSFICPNLSQAGPDLGAADASWAENSAFSDALLHL